MESLGELERLVATVVRVVKTGRTGKRVGTSCSRIDTDNLDVLHSRLRVWVDTSGRKRDSCARQARKYAGFIGDKTLLNVIRFPSESRVKWSCRLSSWETCGRQTGGWASRSTNLCKMSA